MSDYTTAIAALIVVTVALSAAVVYILAQPTDLPVLKKLNRIVDHSQLEPSHYFVSRKSAYVLFLDMC